MHKKSLASILVVGLVLVCANLSLAIDGGLAEDPQQIPAPYRDLRDPATWVPTGTQQALTGSPTVIQTATPRPGTTCDGEWQNGPFFFNPEGWFWGAEQYVAYQDPGTLGSCAGSAAYPFDVTNVIWPVWIEGGATVPLTAEIQPVVYEADLTTPGCPAVGLPACAGPIYTVTFPAPGFYILDFPMPDQCCLDGPFFAGFDFLTFVGPNQVALISDNVGGAGQDCYVYNNWGSGWFDVRADLGLNFGDNTELYSLGFGFNESGCPSLPPDACDFFTCSDFGVAFFWGLPSTSGNDYQSFFMRHTTDAECRIISTDIYFYTPVHSGNPTARISLWESDGIVPTVEVGAVEVLAADINPWPVPTTVDWGPLGLAAHFSASAAVVIDISPNTPDPVNDVLAILTGNPVSQSQGCSGANWGVLGGTDAAPVWGTFHDVFTSGNQYEFLMESYICCDPPPIEVPCAVAGPDDWTTYAHDYQRTSRSSMEVVDPCQVTAAWAYQTPRFQQFGQATVADNVVYNPSDQELTALNLHDGSFIAQFDGVQAPSIFIGANNRCAPTVIGNRVWIGGGSVGGVSCVSADLSTVYWSNDITGVLACEDMSTAGATRFGVTIVAAQGADSVLYIGTEDGLLYALDATTGCLWAGWSVNPVALDGSIFTSPAMWAGNLYVGTSSPSGGSLWEIAAATGVVGWQYDASPEDFSSGPSIDPADGMLYAHSGGDAPVRLKMDPALELGGGEGIVWSSGSGAGLYAPPTIGQDFVYMAQDNPNTGVLKVFKSSGAAAYNWNNDGVFMVTNRVAMTCDAYLFAGDRLGRWWLLDAVNNNAAWYRELGPTSPQQVPVTGIVHGTSIAHSDLADGGDGNDYAVVSVRQSFANPTLGAGAVIAFRFNSGARPRMNQLVLETSINIPLNTLGGNAWSEAGVIENVGCADLNLGPFNVINPAFPTKTLGPRARYAAASVSNQVGYDMLSYWYDGKPTKEQMIAGVRVTTDELTSIDRVIEAGLELEQGKNRRAEFAAGANTLLRTSNPQPSVTPLPPGGISDLNWVYDGTGLGRGIDDDYIELVSDDPDYFPVDPTYSFGHAIFVIHYIGGCLRDHADLEFNGSLTNIEQVWNDGSLGKDDGGGVDWQGEAPLFAGGLIVVDSNETSNQRVVRAGFYDWDNGPISPRFVPDPRPSDATCGHDVIPGQLGQWNASGDPCALDCQPINGTIIVTGYSDTNFAEDPLVNPDGAAIGVSIVMTEVGAENDRYGDFKLIRWQLNERDSEAKTNLHVGTFMDWDAPPEFNDAAGRYSGLGTAPDWNGYFVWDSAAPGNFAWGMAALPLVASSDDCCDVAASDPAYKIVVVRNHFRIYGTTCDPAYCFNGDDNGLYEITTFISGTDSSHFARVIDPWHDTAADPANDNSGLLVWPPFDLAADGSHDVYGIVFGVDATSNDAVVIDALAYDASKRAAKWAGFARGDVNDDGCVNLADVVWLDVNGACVLPHDANGDVNNDGFVNASDKLYLMNYIGGSGPAPVGAWRF